MSAVLSIAGADAAERMRRFSFVVTIAAALYAGYLYVPDIHAGYATVAMNGHRGAYSSAYLAAAISILTSAFLGLIGFYLVRGALERDRTLDVDGVVCASPVRRTTFVFGKFASNLATLCAIAGVSFLAAMCMQELRGEDRHFDIVAYLLPFAFISIPALAMVSALAIAFDAIKPLRGALGAILYVFIWSACLSVPMTTTQGARVSPFDPLGMTVITANLRTAAIAAFPAERRKNDATIGVEALPKGKLTTTYPFAGIRWTAPVLAQRATWLGIALLLVLGSSALFDRYRRETTGSRRTGARFDIAHVVPNIKPFRLLRAEFALLVNGASIWWLAGALGLAIALCFAPIAVVTRFILPVALIWPLERFSALGARERRWNVADILSATRSFAGRTLLAQWSAATLLGSLFCAGYLVRLAATGHPIEAVACIAVVAATAGAALAFGTLTGASRLFEAVYLIVWYLGPINGLPALDFSGSIATAPVALTSICLVLSAMFLSATAIARRVR